MKLLNLRDVVLIFIGLVVAVYSAYGQAGVGEPVTLDKNQIAWAGTWQYQNDTVYPITKALDYEFQDHYNYPVINITSELQDRNKYINANKSMDYTVVAPNGTNVTKTFWYINKSVME